MKSVLKMAWMSVKLSWRIKIAFFFMFIFPMGFFFIYFGLFARGRPAVVEQLIVPLVCLSVISNSMFGVSMQLVVMRERDMLRRYHLAPISPLQMIMSRLLASYFLFLPVMILQFVLAMAIYHMPMPASIFSMWLVLSLGYLALGGFGLMIAGVVNTMQEAQVLNQILFFVLMFLSGATVPLAELSRSIQRVAFFLPPTLMILAGQGLMLAHQTLIQHFPELLGMALTMITSLGLSVALFRWEKEEKATRRGRALAALALIPMLVVGFWLNTSRSFHQRNNYLLDSHPSHVQSSAAGRRRGTALPFASRPRRFGAQHTRALLATSQLRTMAAILFIQPMRFPSRDYSYRSATMGSTLAARRAGM